MSEEIIRIAVMSDIHSNINALDACIHDSKRYKVKYYLFLGDLITDWEHPHEVLKRVRSISDRVIRGNRENAITDRRNQDFEGIWKRFDSFASMEWTYNQLTTDELDYIENLPKQMRVPVNDKYSIRMVHGSVFSPNEKLLKSQGNMAVAPSFEKIEDNILLFGHTHEQWMTQVDGKIAVNPGSVGVHYNGSRCAEYAILEFYGDEVNVLLRQVEYNFDKAVIAAYKSELYEKAYVWMMIILAGMASGRSIINDFMYDIETERMKTDMTTKGPIPNDVWNKVFEEKYSPLAMKLLFGIET